jgi:hypothetical protein
VAMKTVDRSRLEGVGSFLTRVDADIACGALNAAGIQAVVAADDAAGTGLRAAETGSDPRRAG